MGMKDLEGLDVFYVEMREGIPMSDVQNLGTPINSEKMISVLLPTPIVRAVILAPIESEVLEMIIFIHSVVVAVS